MNFLQSFITRVFYAATLLLAVLVLNFSLIHLAPGDVADTIAQSMGGADSTVMAEIRADYGLDQPYIIQLGSYIGKVMQMDLGYSFFYNESVTDLILQRLPATLLLVVLAQVLALFVGVLLGVISAQNPNGLTSHFVTFLALFGYAAPVFWTGILLLIGFSFKHSLVSRRRHARSHGQRRFLGAFCRCGKAPGSANAYPVINLYRAVFPTIAHCHDT
jgi:peptide/nickel transport system permease protein